MEPERSAITFTERTEKQILDDIRRISDELRDLRPQGLPESVTHEERRLERLWEELRAARCFRKTAGRGHQVLPPDLDILRPRRNGRGR